MESLKLVLPGSSHEDKPKNYVILVSTIMSLFHFIHIISLCVVQNSLGANAKRAKDSPEEAMEVTRARRLEKYWARMVTVGRKVRQ